MKGDVEEIMKNVLSMRHFLSNNPSLQEITLRFKDFKEECPKLFELVLEGKPGYFQELEKMVEYARRVKTGDATLEEATKVVKNVYDKKYIYPVVKTEGLTSEQLTETQEYIRNQQLEVEKLEKKWAKNL